MSEPKDFEDIQCFLPQRAHKCYNPAFFFIAGGLCFYKGKLHLHSIYGIVKDSTLSLSGSRMVLWIVDAADLVF